MIPVPEKVLEQRIEQLLEEVKELKAMKRISKFIEIAEENLKLSEENELLKQENELLKLEKESHLNMIRVLSKD